MSEIEITLPTVQYGNVKIRATPEELGVNDISDSYELGVAAAVYLNLFSQGFKYGAALDVDAPQSPSAADVRLAHAIADSVAESAAIQALADGLGGVTEVTSEKAEQDAADIRAQHQAEAEAAGKAPWDAKVEAPKKPWETSVTAPAVLDAAW